MTTITDLPVELVTKIAKNLHDLPDLNALTSSCRGMRRCAEPVLYKAGARRYPQLLCWAADAGEYEVVAKLLATDLDPNMAFETPLPSFHDRNFFIYGTRPFAPLTGISDYWLGPTNSDTESSQDDPSFVTAPLYCAAQRGYLDIVKLLVSHKADIDQLSLGTCECIIPKNPVLLQGRGDRRIDDTGSSPYYNTWTPLHAAICNGHSHIADYLIACGAALPGTPKDATPNALHFAAAHGLTSTVKVLTGGGLPVDTQDSSGLTPLAYAHMKEDCGEMVDLLLKLGANVHLDLGRGCTVLHLVCYHLRCEEAKKLVEIGADVNAVVSHHDQERVASHTQFCHRPLELCCAAYPHGRDQKIFLHTFQSHLESEDALHVSAKLAEYLVAAGADVHPHPSAGASPLVMASSNHHIKVMDLLVRHGANVRQPDCEGSLPLVVAVSKHITTIWGGDIFPHNPSGVQYQYKKGDLRYIATAWLLNRGADVDEPDGRGQTAMEFVQDHLLHSEQACLLQLLLKHGAKPPSLSWALDNFKEVGLEACRVLIKHQPAAFKRYPGIRTLFDLLMKKVRAWVNVTRPRYLSGVPLWSHGAPNIVQDSIMPSSTIIKVFQFLLDIDEDSELLREREYFWHCARYPDTGMAQMLLDRGLQFSLADEWGGETILHRVCYVPSFTGWMLMQRLIDEGADVNRCSPALFAFELGRKDLYAVLINNGAEFPFADPWGLVDDTMWPPF